MSTPEPDEIAVATWPAKERGLLGLLGPRATKIPTPQKVFVVLRDEAGVHGVAPDPAGKVFPGDRELILVARRPFSFEFAFPAVKRDDAGHAWDMVLTGQFCVVRREQFVGRMGSGTLSAQSRLSSKTVATLVLGRLQEQVLDALHRRPLSELRDRTLPARWWESHLNEWAGDFGLEWSVPQGPRWLSATADAARMDAERKRAQEERERRRQEERAAQLAMEQNRREHEERLASLAHDQELSDTRRAQEISLEKLNHSLREKELTGRMQQAAWAHEQAELAHQAKMAEIQGQVSLAAEQKQLLEELSQRNQQALEEGTELRSELKELVGLLRNSFGAGLQSTNPLDAFRAADRLLSPEYGLTVGQLRTLGLDTTLPEFLVALHEAAHADGKVKLELPTLSVRTRDILFTRKGKDTGKKVEVPTLRIGDSLRMHLRSERSGHAAVINFGTSGRIWLNVPSAFCALAETKVEPGTVYALPGSGLMPFEPFSEAGFEDLQEVGPVGREHMIAIVTSTPLFEGFPTAPADAQAPFLQLSATDIRTLHERLATMDRDSWSAAELSFDVVP